MLINLCSPYIDYIWPKQELNVEIKLMSMNAKITVKMVK